MLIEQLNNNAKTTLAESVTDADATSIRVTSAAGFPAEGQFAIVVGTSKEIMLVTAVSGTTFTVARRQEGSAGTTHSSGAEVTHSITAGSLRRLVEQFIATTTVTGGESWSVSSGPVLIYYNFANKKWYLVDADSTTPKISERWAVATTACSVDGGTATAYLPDAAPVVSGFTGLTTGALCWAHESTPGGITTSEPPAPTFTTSGPDVGWDFEENTGSTADSVVSGSPIDFGANGIGWAAGIQGNAVSFNGSNQRGVRSASGLTGSFSISLWFRTSLGGDQQLFYVHVPSYSNYWANLFLSYTGSILRLGGALYDGTNNPNVITGDLALDTWYHAVFVRDTAADQIRLYLDGTLLGSATDTTTSVPSYGDFYIGGRASGTEWLNGRMDHLRIYSRALSANDITGLSAFPADDLGEPGPNKIVHLPVGIAESSSTVRLMPARPTLMFAGYVPSNANAVVSVPPRVGSVDRRTLQLRGTNSLFTLGHSIDDASATGKFLATYTAADELTIRNRTGGNKIVQGLLHL